MTTPVRLNLLVLRCAEPRATAAFYERLGFAFEQHQHGKGPVHLASEQEGFVLELYPTTDGKADTAAVGFDVGDLTATRQRLIDAGFAPGEVRDEPWGRVSVVRDADGRRVELKER